MKQIKIYEMWCDADASCSDVGDFYCRDCEHCQVVDRRELRRDNGGNDVTREIEVEE